MFETCLIQLIAVGLQIQYTSSQIGFKPLEMFYKKAVFENFTIFT